MTSKVRRKRLWAAIAIALMMVLALVPPAAALAEGAEDYSGFYGYLMDVTGVSTNGHFTAIYAWLSDGDLEIFVAFNLSKGGASAWDRRIDNISYDGVNLFGPGERPVRGQDYWYQTGLEVNDLQLDTEDRWLIINYGRQTLADPMIVGMTVHGHGFSVAGMQVPITLYTVTYNGNGGTGVVTDPTPTYQEGDPVTVMANGFTREGYRFISWNTKADGSGATYTPGQTFLMPDHNVVLYAQWEERTLTITASNQTKVYGETFTFSGTEFTVVGLEPGHSVTGVTLTSPGTGAGAAVGTYAVQPSAATGIGLENYTINYVAGSLSVTKAPLTVKANDASKVYDGIAFSGGNGVTYTGFVNGEDESVLTGSITFTGTSQGAVKVGSYGITPGGLTSGNYTINFEDGSLAITPASLVVRANDASKVYDGIAFSGGNGVTYTGFVNGENESVLSGSITFTGTSQGAVNVGSYVITPGGLTSGNYTITFEDGSLAITLASLVVRANDASKVYDGIAFSGGNGVTYTGFVGGEDESVLTGSITFTGTSQGAVKVGSYGITPGGLTSGNYTITFEDGSLAITPASLVVRANDASKVYDGIAFSGGNGVTYTGFVGGEDESVLCGTLTFTGTSQGAVNVGSYVITPGGLTSGNYTITFEDGSMEITRRPIQVTANNLRKDFGAADPALTYRITDGELVAGDVFTGSLIREAGEGVGTYRILQGTLAIGDNYQLTFIEGTLEVVRELPKTGTNVYWFYALGLGIILAGILLTVKARRQL